jgi:transposase InsO family protein
MGALHEDDPHGGAPRQHQAPCQRAIGRHHRSLVAALEAVADAVQDGQRERHLENMQSTLGNIQPTLGNIQPTLGNIQST